MPASDKLPPATLRALEALDASPDKALPINDFRRATGVGRRARHMFLHRLETAGLVFIHYAVSGARVEITFGGLGALRRHREEAVRNA